MKIFFHDMYHSVWHNIVDNIVQNSHIQISVEQITDFRSDSWEKWSTSYQYHVDFVDTMSFKIHERSKNIQNSVLFNNSLSRLCDNELSAKTRILFIFKTRFTESRSQISHYFGGIYHVPQWLISQIVVRCQHYTC